MTLFAICCICKCFAFQNIFGILRYMSVHMMQLSLKDITCMYLLLAFTIWWSFLSTENCPKAQILSMEFLQYRYFALSWCRGITLHFSVEVLNHTKIDKRNLPMTRYLMGYVLSTLCQDFLCLTKPEKFLQMLSYPSLIHWSSFLGHH